jgi:hypothetical protein
MSATATTTGGLQVPDCFEVLDPEHLDAAWEHAKAIGRDESLTGCFEQLERIANNRNATVRLGTDFAPHSFYFEIHAAEAKGPRGTLMLNGGVIFHGPHDRGGDGGAPTFSVNLTPKDGWSIHT